MPSEDDEASDLAGQIAVNSRSWNGFWVWGDKAVAERGIAESILSGAGISCEDLVSRKEGEDPPDCEARIEGSFVGIEVTELVHRRTLERAIRALKERALGVEPQRPEAFFLWNQLSLRQELQKRIDAKENAKLKGGPYERYVLVIHTDEYLLEASQVEGWLREATFTAARITDAFFGLSYDPFHKRCSVFKLRLAPPC